MASSVTAAEHKSVPLPAKFQCRDCLKYKDPGQYSKKNLSNYQWKVANNPNTTIAGRGPKAAGLRCRLCTGEHVTELQCNGPCSLWKSVDEFSKAQRRDPEKAQCEKCVSWKESNEPTVTPMPAPYMDLAPDEERMVTGGQLQVFGDLEGEYDSDDDLVDIASPYEAMSALSVRDETDARSIQGLPKERSHAPSIISTANKTQSSFTAPYGSRTEMSYAPHMLGTQQGLQDAQKPGNDGWSIVGGKKPIPGIAFNAWDNTGQKHSQMRLPSTATGSTAPRTMENLPPTNNTPGRSNWAKVPGRKYPQPNHPLPRVAARAPKPPRANNAEEDDEPDEI